MARFAFAYNTVLRYRELRERQAELRQAQAQQQLQKFIAEQAALMEEVKQTAEGLQTRLGREQSLETWLALYRQVDHLNVQVKAAELRIEKAGRHVQEMARERKQAAQEAEVMRRLRDRQREDHAAIVTKATQRMLDEVGMQRWSRPDEATAESTKENLS